jgi:hypothetical protein
MNFFQNVSIISTEIVAESEYRGSEICGRKMMHFLPTLFQKVSIIPTQFLAESRYFCKRPVCENIDSLQNF